MRETDHRDLSLGEAAVALALPASAISIAESLSALVVSRLFYAKYPALVMLVHGHWLMAIAICLSFYLICSSSDQGILAGAAGLAIAFYCLFHYRGAREWDGTFTTYYRNAAYWELDVLIGAAIGAALGRVRRKSPRTPQRVAGTGLAVIVVGSLLSWWDALTIQTFSPFAPTRQYAVTTLLVIAVAGVIYDSIRAKTESSEGVHAR